MIFFNSFFKLQLSKNERAILVVVNSTENKYFKHIFHIKYFSK